MLDRDDDEAVDLVAWGYYLLGSWNKWKPEAMTRNENGSHTTVVTFLGGTAFGAFREAAETHPIRQAWSRWLRKFAGEFGSRLPRGWPCRLSMSIRIRCNCEEGTVFSDYDQHFCDCPRSHLCDAHPTLKIFCCPFILCLSAAGQTNGLGKGNN